MKLLFDTLVDEVISTISELPLDALPVDRDHTPVYIVQKLEKRIKVDFDNKKILSEQYIKIRRQISFLYRLLIETDTEVLKRKGLVPKHRYDLREHINAFDIYTVYVDTIKNIKSNEILKNSSFVKLALEHGVIYLSDFEINKLITNNRI